MSYRYNYCDWMPINPHPTHPCKGGCGIEVDASDGLCRKCRSARREPPPGGTVHTTGSKADDWNDSSSELE